MAPTRQLALTNETAEDYTYKHITRPTSVFIHNEPLRVGKWVYKCGHSTFLIRNSRFSVWLLFSNSRWFSTLSSINSEILWNSEIWNLGRWRIVKSRSQSVFAPAQFIFHDRSLWRPSLWYLHRDQLFSAWGWFWVFTPDVTNCYDVN